MAREFKREVYRTINGKKAHAGTETRRLSHCPEHNRDSTAFEGVNAGGWIFKCPGNRPTDIPHRFVATPPPRGGGLGSELRAA